MRKKIAIGISTLFFSLMYFGLSEVAGFLGEPIYIDFGERITVSRQFYEIETSGLTTDIGLFIFIISIMFSWRLYHWAVSGKIYGNISIESHITWLFWLLGLSFYILIVTLIRQIEMYYILERIIIFSCIVGIAWFTRNKYYEVIEKIKKVR